MYSLHRTLENLCQYGFIFKITFIFNVINSVVNVLFSAQISITIISLFTSYCYQDFDYSSNSLSCDQTLLVKKTTKTQMSWFFEITTLDYWVNVKTFSKYMYYTKKNKKRKLRYIYTICTCILKLINFSTERNKVTS